MKPTLLRAVACEWLLCTSMLMLAQTQSEQTDLTTLQIEDLMNLDVTSASKKAQKLSQVPTAIFVITKEEIRRSGANNIPDLLRMVPGLVVAQVTPSAWAISARGFNGQFANNLLVLIDGRTVYSPIFAGVFWDAQDVPLDSMERIEIIRGPGAAIWGANAVDGVINIVTKSARDMQNGMATAAGGTLEHVAGMVSYGGLIGSKAAYRVFADGFEMGSYVTVDHQDGHNDWYRYHAGFRVDAELTGKDSLTVEGETVRGNAGELFPTITSVSPPVNETLAHRDIFSGWSVLARWKRTKSLRSESSLQIYFDRSNQGDTTAGVGLNTFDLEFQQRSNWGRRQDLVWGLGFRTNSDDTASTLRLSLSPADLTTPIFSSFVQDEIAIHPGRLYATLGTKFEHEYYNGFNVQPTARITWTPDDRNTFWAAISAAQSTPSRGNTAIRLNLALFPGPNNLPVLASLFGNPKCKNERLMATEAGYRKQVSTMVSFDLAAFFNRYRDLVSLEPGSPGLEADPPPEHLLIPTYVGNGLRGETHGIEAFANVKLASRWTVSPGFTFLTMHIQPYGSSLDVTSGPLIEGASPNQQAQLRSQVNLPRHWQWTTSAYFVSRLANPKVPSYTRLDTNLVWHLSDRISLGLVGQNLLKSLHQEYAGISLTATPSLVRRSGYARLTWRF
jgi:iron complex outermembrane recepter protein